MKCGNYLVKFINDDDGFVSSITWHPEGGCSRIDIAESTENTSSMSSERNFYTRDVFSLAKCGKHSIVKI